MSEMGDTRVYDENDTSDKNNRQSTRPRTLTEKGISYEQEKMLKSSRNIARQIYKYCEKIGKLTSSDDYEQITEAILNLNEAHKEYEQVTLKADHLRSSVPQDDVQAVVLAVTTAKLHAMKVNSPII